MEVEQGEDENEVAMETSMPTQEQLAIAVVSNPTPTPDHTYSTPVSLPTPIPILTSVSSVMPTTVPIYST